MTFCVHTHATRGHTALLKWLAFTINYMKESAPVPHIEDFSNPHTRSQTARNPQWHASTKQSRLKMACALIHRQGRGSGGKEHRDSCSPWRRCKKQCVCAHQQRHQPCEWVDERVGLSKSDKPAQWRVLEGDTVRTAGRDDVSCSFWKTSAGTCGVVTIMTSMTSTDSPAVGASYLRILTSA